MGWLIGAELLSFLTGLGLLLPDERIEALFAWLNKLVFRLDHRMHAIRVPFGLALVISGGWLISVALKFSALWYLWPIGVLVVGCGLLYIFLPEQLNHLAEAADRLLFPTDEFILRMRKKVGVVLIVSAAYMWLIAYMWLTGILVLKV
jgi:hypothetical protein